MNILNAQELLPKRQIRSNYYGANISDNTPNVIRNGIALQNLDAKLSPVFWPMRNITLNEVPITPINQDVKKKNSRSIFNRHNSLNYNIRSDRGFLSMLDNIRNNGEM